MKLSNKILSMQYSPIRKFSKLANEAERIGRKVYYLNIGQPDIKTPDTFTESIKNYRSEILAYAPSGGLPELIEAVKRYYARYGMIYEDNNIIITNGGSEALSFIMTAILNNDDEVIVPEPFYTNYNVFVTSAGGRIVPLTTFAEDGFHYAKKQEIERLVTSKTKAILLCNPGNPTGTILTREEMKMIVDFANSNNLFIIADEVYREFVYDNQEMTSFGQIEDSAESVIIVDSVSKRFSACGARIGSIITKNQELYSNIMKLAQGRLCCPTIEQIAATALYDLNPSYFNNVRDEYERRRDVVYNELSKIEGIVCKKPCGAFYITAKLPVENTEDFLIWILSEFEDNGETVMFAPAEGFYATKGLGKNEIRIAYVLKEEDMIRGVELLRIGLDAYNNRNQLLSNII